MFHGHSPRHILRNLKFRRISSSNTASYICRCRTISLMVHRRLTYAATSRIRTYYHPIAERTYTPPHAPNQSKLPDESGFSTGTVLQHLLNKVIWWRFDVLGSSGLATIKNDNVIASLELFERGTCQFTFCNILWQNSSFFSNYMWFDDTISFSK